MNKIIYNYFIEILLLAAIAMLSFSYLNSEYLFQWAAHNWVFSLILCLAALLPLLFNKRIVSAFLTAGISIGIFAGNYIGGLIKEHNISKITDGMSAEEIHRLRSHPGFGIWIAIILVFLVIGVGLQFIAARKRKRTTSSREDLS